MAIFTAYQAVDMTDVNFYRVTAGGIGAEDYTNVPIAGVTYPRALEVDWLYNGVEYGSLFAGNGLAISYPNNFVTVSGGTLTAYFEASVVNGQIGLDYAITGINYPAVTLYNDFLTPSTADDFSTIQSMLSGADTINGSTGNDIIYGLGGNDTINGGGGLDTAVYVGSASQYVISNSNGTITVTDTIAGRDGADTLHNIQQLEFGDYTLVFDLQSSQDLLVYKIYQAAYGRTPDNAGFRYWAGAADATHASAVVLADQFLVAPEFKALYGTNPSNTAYITGLYTHVLGRAPDQGGLDYWVGQANAGQPKDQLLVDFAVSAENAALIGSHVSNGYWTTH
jgi:hypothetical protein